MLFSSSKLPPLSDVVIGQILDRLSGQSTSNVANLRGLRGLLPRDANVDTSLLILQCGCSNMSSLPVYTGGGCMISIPTDPMGPTVVELDPITHYVGSGGGAWSSHSSARCPRSRGSEGTMIARGPSGKPAKALSITTGNLLLEMLERPTGRLS